MKQKEFDFRGASRSDQRAKRRKTNLILNSLIVIVILLIIIVSYSIFFGNGEKASTTAVDASSQAQENQEENSEGDASKEDSATNEESQDTEGNGSEIDTTTDEDEDTGADENETDTTLEEPESDNIVSEGGTDPNVKNTITNPDWQPIGTSQSGEHVPVYDSASIDWKEMEKAISYGTGLNQSDMTVWFLGRNKAGAENQSVATVSTKDNSITYRVYIEWVDGQGWKPIKIEELIENDKR